MPNFKIPKDPPAVDISGKVDKVTGKGLSTNDLTTTLKNKLDGIEAGANNYVHPSGDGNLHVPATSTTNSGKVLTAGVTAGALTWETPNTGVADIEVVPLIDPIVNTSSQGDTYVDTAGNVYAETTHQTRSTMPSVKRKIVFNGNAHVSAGTGTIAIYNVTDGTVIGSTTTTSTTRANISVSVTATDTNNSDVITVQVKNSTAGASVTIDHGGFMVVESSNTISSISATALFASARMSKTSTMKLVIMGSHTGTPLITGRVVLDVVDGVGVHTYLNITTDRLTESDESVVITSNLLYNIPLVIANLILFSASAITGTWVIGVSFQQTLL